MGDESAHYILATAGHVDHGKSSLVKALTGSDPDRLPEEKARGITIDLGFASLELSGGLAAAAPMHVGIVDVPGHEDFVKNMVSGVSAIDLALLVVAADDGWMPQTEEHLQILEYLGVTRCVVALNKIDLANDAPGTASAVRQRLAGTAFAASPIVPVSTVSGHGIDDLRSALETALANAPRQPDAGKPRLAIDRAFSMRGIGTVVTGTLIGGRLEAGQAVVLQATGQATRIRSLQNHNQQLAAAVPGMRTAVNLPDIPVAGKAAGEDGARRGQWITLPNLGTPSRNLDVLLIRSGRTFSSSANAARPLKDGARVRVHHGAQNAFARVFLADAKESMPGSQMLAQIRVEEPLFAFLYDRLVLRDTSEQVTLAGALVLGPHGERKTFRNPDRQRALRERAKSPDSAVVAVASELALHSITRRRGLLVQSRFSAGEIDAAVEQLSAANELALPGEFVADAKWWRELKSAAGKAVDEHHQRHPERPGITFGDLRSTLAQRLPIPDAFDLLLSVMGVDGFTRTGSTLGRNTHRPSLPSGLEAAGAQLRTALSAKPLDPPSRKELSATTAATQALRFLIQSGEAIEVGSDVVLLAEAYQQAVQSIRNHLHAHGSATVSDLRQAVGASRRIVVPLLEKLDKQGLTRRQGDARSLRPQS